MDFTKARLRGMLIYVGLLVGAVGAFAWVDSRGAELLAPAGGENAGDSTPAVGTHGVLPHVLLTLTAVVGLGWLLARLFRWLGQPPVIGEVIAGIALGPSILGRIVPESSDLLLPPSAAPFLGIIAQLGVILYMFLIGLELNLDSLKERTQAIVLISHAGIVIPFVSGAGLALFLYPRLSSGDVLFTSFALFMGVAMSITAFPVLARILSDQNLQKTPLGVTALACAAMNDVTAWCLLALVVGVVQAKISGAIAVIAWTVVFVAGMFGMVRPLAARWLISEPGGRLSRSASTLTFVALLASALATEFIGIHAIFGAFLLGAVIPHDSAVAREFTDKLEDLVTVLLLPAFFAYTGLRTQIGLIAGAEQWLICGLIVAVATAGKVGGTLLSARWMGLGWRDSSALGILMNTRGLMELIVLNIGLDLKVISPTLFAMMVLMALATTVATPPFLRLTGIPVASRPNEGERSGVS